MASTDAKPFAQKNVAYRVTFPILDADGDLVTGATGLDSEISKDGGTFTDCTNEATEIATSSGMYYLDLTSTEMNADTVAIIVKTSSSGAKTTPMVFYPEEAGDIRVNATQWNSLTTVALPLVPTTAGRSLDVSATGEAGIDWANIGSPTTAVNLSGTNIDTDQVVASVSGAVGSVTGNVGGNVTGSIGSVATGGITAGSIAADAIGASELAADAITEIQSGLATAAALTTIDDFLDTEIAAIKTVTDAIGATGSGLTAIPWNAAWDAEVQSECADALTAYDPPTHAELTSGLASADDATLAAIAALNNLSAAQVNAEVDTALADINLDHLVKTAVDTDWATTVHLNSVLGHVADNGTSATFDRTTDSLEALQAEHDATQAKVDTVDDFLDTEIAAIKAKTDNLPASPANEATLTTIAGYLDTEIAAILADTNELQTDWANGGRLDLLLDAASSAGDPWTTSLPGAYGAGTAGKIIGDNINATISSRASQTSVDTIDDLLDTEVAALTTELAKVPKSDGTASWNATAAAQIQSEANDALVAYDPPTRAELTTDTNSVLTAVGDVPTNAELATALGTADDATLAAIAALSIPTAAAVADAVWDEDATAHQTQGTFGQAIGDPGADTDTIFALVNTNLNATVGSRASQTSVDDLPTNAELATALGTADDAVLTAIDALPTNAELATALGTADDAVLAAIAALNNLSEANIRTALGMATANLDTQLAALAAYIDTEVAAIKAKTDNLPASPANEATLTTIAGYIDTEVAAIKAKTDNLPTDPADASDIAASFASIASTLSTLSAYVDTEVAAIKAKTDSLTFTVANQLDANIQYVNDVAVTGTGASGDEWGPV